MIVAGTVKIGLLGGIGPESTGLFYNKLINGLQKKNLIKSNRDYPQIFINSIPAPELVFDEYSEEDLQYYLKGLKELDKLDVDFIVMVCNTIHVHLEFLQNHINTPILDLRQEFRKFLLKNDIMSVTILGTPTTINKDLYHFSGVHRVNIRNHEFKILSNAIYDFNRGYNKEMQSKKVSTIAKEYHNETNKVVLGCTELSIMLGHLHYIDIMDILVNSTIKNFILLK